MNKSSKIWAIIRFEFMTRIKSKGFIIGTILGPILLLAVVLIPGLVAALTMEETSKKIMIVDESKKIYESLLKKDNEIYSLSDKKIDELKEEVLKGKIDAFLFIPKDVLQTGKAVIYTPGGGGIGLLEKVKNNLTDVVIDKKLIEFGADSALIKFVDKGITVTSEKVTQAGTQKDYTEFYSVFGYVLGFMIYMLMFAYGGVVMRGVITEKANRIVEVLNSSAKSFEIMMGKIFGIGAVGLVQVLVWVGILILISLGSGSIIGLFVHSPASQMSAMPGQQQAVQQTVANLPFQIPPIPIGIWIAFVFFFLAGYFIYSALFAAIGSAVDQEEDAAQLQMPVTIPLIIPILFMTAIMSNPDGTLSIVLSLFPPFTPILMTARIAATTVPAWQIVLSVILTIGMLLFSIWFASKIYRVGILSYGKKPSFKEIIKWIKIAK